MKCKKCNTKENLTIDHIIPKKWGGLNCKSNKMVLCRKCHNWKEENTYRIFRINGQIDILHPMFKIPLKKQDFIS